MKVTQHCYSRYIYLAQGVWAPFMMNAQDLPLDILVSRGTRAGCNDQNSILVRSEDGGKIWGEEKTIP